nr:immunoglobulin light chain junction region [Macaca mulatta]
CQQGDSSPYTF